MDQELLYLRPNTMMEPLVDGWYAWAHLIPPATTARNITERHIRIMDSYVANPDAHAAAVQNPALLGGPFMDFPRNSVAEVEALRARTLERSARLVELSAELQQLDEMLRTKAQGASLEPLYAEVPAGLKGLVELVYDLNHNPSFRLIEPLLYRSRYYDPSLQSIVLSEIAQDDRPFVLSTPRIHNDRGLELPVPFASETVDFVARLKTHPERLATICERLGLQNGQRERLLPLLTSEAPRPYARYQGEGARWRYFGHACILVETRSVSVLLDPVLSYTYENEISRYTYEDLPAHIDYVLITHNHQDHILFETLLQLRHRIGTIVVPRNSGGALQDPSLRLLLKQCGFHNVVELDEMDQIHFEDGAIQSIPFFGEHGDLNVHTKSAWLMRTGGHALLFAADSCNIEPELYAHVQREIGNVDVLFLGMECDGAPMSWIYGPLLTRKLERQKDHSRRLAGSDFARARAIVDQFGCKEVYVYAMGQEPWLNYIMSIKYSEQSKPIVESNRLVAYCHAHGITAERLFGEREILLG
jgi:L-ascorbate metabolism protein UlaG (beta-lactamase superfamily)